MCGKAARVNLGYAPVSIGTVGDAGQWEGFMEPLTDCDDRHSLLSG